MMKGKAFSFPERYSYSRERLGSHLREPDGSQKTVAILSDVIAVIDEYSSMTAYSSISAGTVVRGFDFLELAQHLNEQTALGLHAVRG